jgi:hypothetical protein
MRNDRREDDLFDETRLRRALRLEAAELPPRLDVVAIAAHARADRPAFAAASLVSTLVAGAAAAGLVGLIAVTLPAVAPALASDLFTAAIGALANVAIPASALLSLAAQPTVPVAAIAALAVAIVYEYAQRRESLREVTS